MDKNKPDSSKINVNTDAVNNLAETINIEKQTINIFNYPEQPHSHITEITSSEIKRANPYKGLEYFGPQDAKLFFGRDKEINHLIQIVSQNSFTAIIGPSGSGKSSIVLAGIAPRLHQQGHFVFSYFRVSDHSINDPFVAMASALVPFYFRGFL